MRQTILCLLSAVTLISATGCRPAKSAASNLSPACSLALAPHAGGGKVDAEIARLQQEARRPDSPNYQLERLGWMFVAKARESYDPGYYRLAEQCTLCLESRKPAHARSAEALLLRGHALHNLHRFQEAEALARQLVAARGLAFDHGLLGDVLMEQGRLNEAVTAYQRMMDLKPGLQAYSRAAQLRWLKGDLVGALEAMRLAVQSASPRDGEAAGWAYVRLAHYELQAGAMKKALADCDVVLRFQPDYAPALLERGRILLAEGKSSEAIESLKRAASLNPLPEYQWALSEALSSAGRLDEARLVEAQLIERGAASDPRTLSLFLATRGEQTATALDLAEQEMKVRADVFTLDALAWALAAAGRVEEAHATIERALQEGTEDARLFFHAGAIAARAGQRDQSRRWLKQAAEIKQMLLPSEREQLFRQLRML